jgi:hypothetical protein
LDYRFIAILSAVALVWSGCDRSTRPAGRAVLDAGDGPEDAAAAGRGFDGQYVCRGTGEHSDSCTQPLTGGEYDWTLSVDGDRLTLTSIGFGRPEYSCAGQWMSSEFTCGVSWSRGGRGCSSTWRVRVDAPGMLTFWPYERIEDERASCHSAP